MHDASGASACLLGTISTRDELRARPDDAGPRREQLLRETVVREMNHRINNSLQGLIAMMRLQATQRMSVHEAIDQSVAQLVAASVAFGLASQHGEAIPFCDLVAGVVRNAEQVSRRRIRLQVSPASVKDAVMLTEQHGANIGLVINELVFNALKHGSQSEVDGSVHIFIDRNDDSAELRILNETGHLPAGFSLESGSGLGMGLSLIKLLVPREGCRLSMTDGPEGVCARLVLRQPVLYVAHT